MCTCLDLKARDYYFGRNLDLEYNFNEEVVITPRKYSYKLKNGKDVSNKYAMIGMATVCDNYPLYADAANEKGLCMAGLMFPQNAFYPAPQKDSNNIASYELILWILGNFKSVDEVKKITKDLVITNEVLNNKMPSSELHWIISDKDKSIVLEEMKDGLHVYDNKYGILTNNPPFPYHELNVINYINISPRYPSNRFSDKLCLTPFAQSFGSIGLPGDLTPQSRFVRTAFNKFNARISNNNLENVAQFFHILDNVAFIDGTTITKENKYDKTMYSSCINVTNGIYYYKTYNNNQITAVKMTDSEKNKKSLSIYPLIIDEQINYIN